jgi:two-component system sensor histidine kinase RegB
MSNHQQASEAITLRWIIRLRWVAVIGQILAMIFASALFDVHVPWIPVIVIIAVTIFSNLWLSYYNCNMQESSATMQGSILLLDVLLLTALLYFTGGPHNPFTSFYLLHVALAAMSVPARWLWSLVAVCTTAYAIIFFYHHPVVVGDMKIEQGCPSYSWHLQGMAVAFVITSACIGSFVSRMQRVLRQRDQELIAAQLEAAEHAQFASLATLSAGVAHELGSPLGTISLASSELLEELQRQQASSEIIDDVKLICSEVTRCRSILDRLRENVTDGIGESDAEICVADLWKGLQESLPAELIQRITFTDLTHNKPFIIPKIAMIQAIAILLNNAHQADRGLRPIELEISYREEILSCVVRDHGEHLTQKIIERAGEPFFSTKEPGQGMGLGLFLVRTLAMRLGGDLRLSKLSPNGTQAMFTILYKSFAAKHIK